MKQLLLGLIKVYWLIIPPIRRKKCLFKKTCSKAVFEATKETGFLEGIKVFKYRFKNCRGGYEIYENPFTYERELMLTTKKVLSEKEMASWLLSK